MTTVIGTIEGGRLGHLHELPSSLGPKEPVTYPDGCTLTWGKAWVYATGPGEDDPGVDHEPTTIA